MTKANILHLKTARFMAKLLDVNFGFGPFRFGIAPLLGLIPGFGDIVANLLSFYLIFIGLHMQVPGRVLLKMLTNIGINFFMGLIPVIGDIGDFAFKSNMKNLKLLEDYVKSIENVIEGEIIEPKLIASKY